MGESTTKVEIYTQINILHRKTSKFVLMLVYTSRTYLLLKNWNTLIRCMVTKVTRCHILFKENIGRMQYFVKQPYCAKQCNFNTSPLNNIDHICVSDNSC